MVFDCFDTVLHRHQIIMSSQLPHHALMLPKRCSHWFQKFMRSPHCVLAHASLRMGTYLGAYTGTYGHHQAYLQAEWSAFTYYI